MINKILIHTWLNSNENDEIEIQSTYTKDKANEILSSDIELFIWELKQLLKEVNVLHWLDLLNDFLSKNEDKLDKKYLSVLYEIWGDYYMKLCDHDKSIENYKLSQECWNLEIYKKISKAYNEKIEAKFKKYNDIDNISESMFDYFKETVKLNKEVYAEYWENIYNFTGDYKEALIIFEEWIANWSKASVKKYLDLKYELYKNNFILKDNSDKPDFDEIISLYNKYIDLWNYELIWKLWEIYEDNKEYYKAVLSYDRHIKIFWNSIYSHNLAQIYEKHSDELRVLNINFEKELKIHYQNAMNFYINNNDIENYLNIFDKLSKIYINLWNDLVTRKFYINVLRDWGKYKSNEIKEKVLVTLLDFYKNNIEMQINILNRLVNLKDKYYINLAMIYEKIDIKKAIILYNEMSHLWVYDSHELFWMFIEENSHKIENIKNKNFLLEIAKKIYSHNELNDFEYTSLKEIL